MSNTATLVSSMCNILAQAPDSALDSCAEAYCALLDVLGLEKLGDDVHKFYVQLCDDRQIGERSLRAIYRQTESSE